MTIAIATAGFAISVLCALVMGYAIQRGATCTVVAVSQLVEQGRWGRFIGLMEAALWVAGGLLIALQLGLLPELPLGNAVTGSTIIGGVFLGVGAYVNRGCVFGTIARIGSRDWAYLATPVGFLVGAWLSVKARGTTSSAEPQIESLLGTAPSLAILLFLSFAIWRILRTIWSKDGTLVMRIWAPHEATVVIGIAFAIMFVAAGPWAYTDLLAEFAHGMPGDTLSRLLLVAALMGGSIISGSTNGAASQPAITIGTAIQKFAGGAGMGVGSLLIPGSNDGLILVGMPLFYSYAWVGIGVMCLTIVMAIHVERQWTRFSAARHATG